MSVRRLLRFLAWLLAGVTALAAAAWWMARPTVPDAFYRPPTGPPPRPGVLLRQEVFERRVPADARAWRILYTTTRADGTATVASAIVVVFRASGSDPRPVVAWTHGTTGIVPGCGPSLLGDPFANVPALRQLLDKGWIYVATDYAGQGASGPNPYLVGEGEARSALDSVRALRQMADVHAGDDVVVWGHSQGGHAALWTGILAPTYAPDVNIRGVAAVAPASDLRPLLDAIHGTPIGRIMSSFLVHSYADAYPDVRPDDYLSAFGKWVATDVASRCLAGPGTLFSLFEALVLRDGIFAVAPTSGPLGERLRQNTPDRLLPQPVLIAQGLADDLVLPKIQSRFAQRRCDFGQSLDYRTYAGRDHLSVIAPDSPLTGDLVRWTQDRFDRVPVPEACSGDLRR